MASESSDEGASLSLPSDLEEWIDRKAAALGLDRETVVVQLLASYRAAEELEEDPDAVVGTDDLEPVVREVVAERIQDIAGAVREHLEESEFEGAADAAAVEERLAAELDRAESELDGEIDRVESTLERDIAGVEDDFAEKVRDVRQRVVQVKREADAKAPADHTHGELDELAGAVADLEATLTELDETIERHDDELATVDDRLAAVEDAVDRLDDVEERLRTVAWVVSDLKDAVDAQSAGTAAIDRLKHAAAELDVDRAVCENCSNAVDVALLSTPQCPHCDATVSDVELPGGLFGKPKLTVARRLEAGEGGAERSNVPDAAERRGQR